TSVPVLTTFMVISVLASAGLPGLNGFVGEFLILLGSFKSTVIDSPILVAFATSGVILAAMYLLHMLYRTFFGELTHEANVQMPDLNAREFVLMAPLIVLMFVLGFFPNPFLRQTAPTTEFLLETVEEKRAAVEVQAADDPVTADDSSKVPVAPPETEEVSVDVPEIAP
ncbi:MAG: Fe-S-binding domain-containing protein, partial [Bacteroidetes bacterium QH_10_64_19]